MGRLSVLSVVCLSLGCAWSYYPQQSAPPPNRIIYRHHYPAYPTPIMGPPLSPFPFGAPSALSYAPAVPVGAPIALPYSLPAPPPQQQSPFSPPAPPYGAMPYAAAPSSMVPYRPVPYGGPPVNQILYNHHIPFSPAATLQHLQFTRPQSPRNPFGNPFAGFQTAAFSHHVPKQSIFTKLKPYLLGNPGQRSLPHHPYYPNQFHPHQFTPSRPLQNRPAAHHQYPVHQQAPDNHLFQHLKQEHSCSCSLHVGHLTVYKHTDMRSSYSCNDLKDCNSFCTNLFSSEDLRAQTRSDACLILGKDGSVPWFRRDQVCDPHGIKNDTKLSVDLCCKQLQPC